MEIKKPTSDQTLHPQSLILAQRLKKLRETNKLSHVELSKALKREYNVNISKDSLINYEVTDPHHTRANKNLGMNVRYLTLLADFFGVSADYLIGIDEPKTANDQKGGAPMSTNSFRREVGSYYHATLNIFFTDEPCCDRCPLMETYARKQCRVTGEYLSDTRFCGYMCPLIIGDEKTNAREVMNRE